MTTNPLPFITSVLSTTPSRWQNLTETLPTELLIRPPAINEWSALDCLRHLLDTEQLVFPVNWNTSRAAPTSVMRKRASCSRKLLSR